jgi:hypothetical protein
MAGGHVGALARGTLPISGRPSCVTGRKQACRAMIFSARNSGDSRSQIACRRSISPGSGVTAAGSSGSGAWSEKAVTCVLPSARGNTSTVTARRLALIFEEQRIRRHVRAGVVDEARTSLPEHGGQSHPSAESSDQGPSRHDGIRRDDAAIDLDTLARPSAHPDDAGDRPRRSSAPCACAALIMAAVNGAG